MKLRSMFAIVLLLFVQNIYASDFRSAQSKPVVALFYDSANPAAFENDSAANNQMTMFIENELVALTEGRGGVTFVYGSNLQHLLANPKVSLVIATGPKGSGLVQDVGLHETPVIAAFSPDSLQRSIERDKMLFGQMFGLDSVQVVCPFGHESDSAIKARIDSLVSAGIPVLAYESRKYLQMGATITFLINANHEGSYGSASKVARETAIRALQFLEGGNAQVWPIEYGPVSRTTWVNMESLNKTGAYPNWSLMQDVAMINVGQVPGNETTLSMAVSIALENNIKQKIAQSSEQISQKDVAIAKSVLLPSLELSGSAVQLSQNLVEASMGQRGEFTFTGSLTLRQVIYSQAAYSNIAIKKLMEQMESYNSQKVALDIVLEVAEAYTGLVFARNLANVANNNVNATLANLGLAVAKEKEGDLMLSDVRRWESELSMSRMELNDARARHRAAMYRLNQLLAVPLDTEIDVPDTIRVGNLVALENSLLEMLFSDLRISQKYAGFLTEQLYNNSPELKIAAGAGEIARQRADMYKSQRYMPEVALIAGADQAFIREGMISNPQLPVPPPPEDITWNIGVRLSFPLFNGGKIKNEVAKANVQMSQAQLQQEDLRSRLEQAVMYNVQFLNASYHEMKLANDASEAAEANFAVVRDAYSNGVADVSRMIDAQKALYGAKTMVLNSSAQFVLDFLKTERLQGNYTFLGSEKERLVYKNNLVTYLNKVKF